MDHNWELIPNVSTRRKERTLSSTRGTRHLSQQQCDTLPISRTVLLVKNLFTPHYVTFIFLLDVTANEHLPLPTLANLLHSYTREERSVSRINITVIKHKNGRVTEESNCTVLPYLIQTKKIAKYRHNCVQTTYLVMEQNTYFLPVIFIRMYV